MEGSTSYSIYLVFYLENTEQREPNTAKGTEGTPVFYQPRLVYPSLHLSNHSTVAFHAMTNSAQKGTCIPRYCATNLRVSLFQLLERLFILDAWHELLPYSWIPSSKLVILIPFEVREQKPSIHLSCFRCQPLDEMRGSLSVNQEGNRDAQFTCRYLHLKIEESRPNLLFPQRRSEIHSKKLIL